MLPRTSSFGAWLESGTNSIKRPSLPDEKLLDLFFDQHDDAAFAEIISRHGPLVYNVCRRVLADTHAAEDAFQATFLVLVRKGTNLRQPGRLANWLYGVAYRTALRAKTRAKLLGPLASDPATLPPTRNANEMTLEELRKVLDEEVSQLPEKYALPLVLCYLEGKSNAQAASQLGWPIGSISRRLSRARELLRSRLAKRGLTASVALIAAVFAQPAAAIPPQLLLATQHSSSLLAQGAPLAELVSPQTADLVSVVSAAKIGAGSSLGALVLTGVIGAIAVIAGWEMELPRHAMHAASRMFPQAFAAPPRTPSEMQPCNCPGILAPSAPPTELPATP